MEQLKNILFIDIETVSVVPQFEGLGAGMQAEWAKKSKYLKSNTIENAGPSELFAERAGIFSEFAKVVCIGLGSFHKQGDEWKFRLKSITNSDEGALLYEFCEVLTNFTKYYPDLRFCGHNIKEFDIPFLCRRMLINNMGLPDCLQLSNKKPWEILHIDTLELWRFGDYKNYTSLSLLAEVLGIPSPKDDLNGSMVGDVYWKQNDLPRIAKYCLQDVLTSAKVFLKLKGILDIAADPVYVTD